MLVWCLGASIILVAFLFPADGCNDCAMEGNGRKARDVANAGLRLERGWVPAV